jgi:hypothetical protein
MGEVMANDYPIVSEVIAAIAPVTERQSAPARSFVLMVN